MTDLTTPPRVCSIEPFVSSIVAQPGSLEEAASALELLKREVEDYLDRLREAVCNDITAIQSNCCS